MPMKTVRLGTELEKRLAHAARKTGQPESQIIRDAVKERCDDLLEQQLRDRLGDVIGVVASRGGQSRRTGRQRATLLARRRKGRT